MTHHDTAATPHAATAKPKRQNRVHVAWAGGQRFDAGRPNGPSHRMDADGVTGPGPVDTVLGALAACTSVDIVSILEKRKTPLESLTIDVTGDRADATPAKLTRIHLHYTMRGAGIERVHAERAVELSVTKYCSVRDSLDPEIPVEWTVSVNDG